LSWATPPGTGTVTGSGTAQKIPKWTAGTALGDSILSETIAGITVTLTQGVATSGQPTAFRVIGGAHTTLAAGAEAVDIAFNLARTVQFATGALLRQRAAVFQAPTYGFVGSSIITTAATVAIEGAPAAGTFATITNPLALWVQGGKILHGSGIASNVIETWLQINGSISATASRTTADLLGVWGTIAANAVNDSLRGALIFPTYAKGSLTGLAAYGLQIGAATPTGSGTIAQYSGLFISEQTFATSNVGIVVGGHPGGSTNFAAYFNSANAVYLGTGTVTAAGGLNVGSGAGAGIGEIVGSHGANGAVAWGLTNTTAGTAAETGIGVANSSGDIANLGIYSSSTTAYGALAAGSAFIWTSSANLVLMVDDATGVIAFASGGSAARWTISAAGHLNPVGAGLLSIGDATNYINDLSYKTLTDRGCLGWFDDGVEMPDGSLVSDTEALLRIKKHPSLETVYGVPRLDYSTMPKAVYKPIQKEGETEGAETTSLISIMLGAIRELTTRVRVLEGA